jgi:hypothetical protein
MGIEVGLIGLIILIADVWAIVQILGSGAPPLSKTIWAVVILVLPVIGLLVWFFAGPRAGRA